MAIFNVLSQDFNSESDKPRRIERVIDLILEISWLLIIFLLPIYFNWYQSYDVFEIGKIVLFRIMVEIMAIFFLLKILFFKVKSSFSLKKLLPFIIFFLVVILATFFSPYFYTSFWGSYFRHLGLYSLLYYFIFFLILIFSLRKEKQTNPIIDFADNDTVNKISEKSFSMGISNGARRIIIAILLSSFVVCSYALLQIFDFDFFKWETKFSYSQRLTSTFGQPNFLGSFLILVFPLIIVAFKLWTRFWQKIILIILGFLEIFILILTLSRAAWFGFLGFVVFLSIIYLYLKKKKKLLLFFIALIVLGISLIFFNKNYFDQSKNPLLFRLTSALDFNTPTAKFRLLYWRAVPEIIKSRPFLGYGPESQYQLFTKYYGPESIVYEEINSHPDRAHNEILDILLTTGVLGLLSYLFLMGYVFYRGLREGSLFSLVLLSALFAYIISNQFGFPTITTNLYFWLYLALIMVISNKSEKENNYRLNFNVISKIFILIAVIATSFILIKYKNINLLKADYYFYQAKADKQERNLVKLMDDYEKVFTNDFYELYYRWQAAQDVLFLTAKFKNQEIKKDILEIALKNLDDISPKNQTFEFLAVKANLLNDYGLMEKDKFKEAEEIYLKLSEISPQIAALYNDWGRKYLFEENYQQAIEKFEKALTLYPINHPDILCCNRLTEIREEMSNVYFNLGQSYFFLKEYPEAIEYYRSALRNNPYNIFIYKGLANSYYLQGDLNRAIEEDLKALSLDPENKELHESLFLLYKEKGDLKKAKEYEKNVSKL